MDSLTPLMLTTKQIVSLDQQRLNIRAESGAAIARVHIIRAMIDSLADIDLSQCRSENDIRVLFTERLQGSATA